jgi:hypothetical protein
MASAKWRNGPGEEHAMLAELLGHFGKQAQLAEALGVNESTVFRWISDGKCPQARHTRAIRDLYQRTRRYTAALERSLEELVAEDEDDVDPS